MRPGKEKGGEGEGDHAQRHSAAARAVLFYSVQTHVVTLPHQVRLHIRLHIQYVGATAQICKHQK
jgi:hypothetical protein